MTWSHPPKAESWFPYLHRRLSALLLPTSLTWLVGVEGGAVLVRGVPCRWSCASRGRCLPPRSGTDRVVSFYTPRTDSPQNLEA